MNVRFWICWLLALLPFVLFGQSQRETRYFGQFDEVKVSGNLSVVLQQGDEPSAYIEAEGIELDKIVTQEAGNTLQIKLKPGIYREAEIRITLTYQELSQLRAMVGAQIIGQSVLSGDKLEIYAGSGGQVDLEVDVQDLEQRVMEGSRIQISGRARVQEALVYTGGVLEAASVESLYVFARVNTGGVATIKVLDELEASVGTGGKLTYHGNPPKETLKTHLGATIVKAGE